jgi:Anti-sigma-K factor rskA
MTADHQELRDLLAPVALGAADPSETTRVEAHAVECAVCAEELAGLRGTANALALAVPQHDPPPGLRDALMASVRAEAAARAADAQPPPARAAGPPPRARWWRRPVLRPWPALAAAAAVVAVLLAWNIALQVGSDGGEEQVTTLAVAGTPDAPGVTGRVAHLTDDGTAIVRLAGLPRLAAGDAYQLWVIDGGTPRSAALFEPEGPGEAVAVAADLQGAEALAVTAQPATSRAAPEGPILLTAPLESG